MKRITALIFAAAFMLMTAFPVCAAAPFSVVLSAPQEITAGELLCVTVSFENIPSYGICGVDMFFDFDTSCIAYDSVELVDFPDGRWLAAGRKTSGGCAISVFDDFSNTFSHIQQGSNACIKIYFTTNPNAGKLVDISLQGDGAVSGSCYRNGEVASVNGSGNMVSVGVFGIAPDASGNGWVLKDGNLYCQLGTTAGDINNDTVSILGKDGDDAVVTGDVFMISGYKSLPVGVRFDVNGDGTVSTVDYLLLKKHMKNSDFSANGCFAACDANMDGGVTTTDAFIFRLVLSGGQV